MPCATCDHTMEGLGVTDRGDKIFHCPRCGTVKAGAFGLHGYKVYVPKIVDHLREFYHIIRDSPEGRALKALAHQHGITESILKPGDRK